MKNFIQTIPKNPLSNKSLLIILFVIAFYGNFLYLQLRKYNFNPSAFITAGDYFTNPELFSKDFIIIRGSSGYDGQFYYRFARNPFSNQMSEFGIKLDNPNHRQQRFIYPFITWMLSFGQAELVPIVLILVNLIFLCIMGYLGAKICAEYKMPGELGLLFPLYGGFLFTLAKDLNEIVEITFILAGILALKKGKIWLSTMLFSLAILSKETSLLVPFGLFLTNVFYRDKLNQKINWRVIILPIFTYFIFQIILFIKWGNNWTNSIPQIIVLPFQHFIPFILSIKPAQTLFQFLNLADFVLVIFYCIIILFAIIKRRINQSSNTIIWLLYLLLTLSLSKAIWIEDLGYIRATSELAIFGLLILLESKSKAIYHVLAGFLVLWLLIGFEVIIFR